MFDGGGENEGVARELMSHEERNVAYHPQSKAGICVLPGL